MAHHGTASQGFLGLDPPGLRDLARLVLARARALHTEAALARIVAEATATPRLARAADGLQRTGADLVAWSRDLDQRIEAIERVCAVPSGVVATLVRRLIGAAREAADEQRRRPQDRLGIAAAYGRIDGVLVDGALSGEARDRRLRTLVAAIDAADLPLLAHMLISGGHDLGAVAALGAAAGIAQPDEEGVLNELEDLLRNGDLVAGVLAGSYVAEVPENAAAAVGRWLADHPDLVASVMRGAAVAGTGKGRVDPGPRRIADLVAGLDDAARVADVVVALMMASPDQIPAADRILLDDAIRILIGAAPRAVMTELATVADRDALAMVSWMQHLVGVERGPRIIGGVVDGVVGPDHMDPVWFADPGSGRRFENATTAAYLATSLSIAVVRDAENAHTGIDVTASIAAFTEMLLPAAGRATRAVEILAPVGFTAGVGAAAHHAHGRIDEAFDRLLERIAERFEIPADTSAVDLARALSVFDERRDALVDRWSEHP